MSTFEEKDGNTNASQNASSKQTKTPTIDAFGRDLTKEAAENLLDPVIGRDTETERVAQILSRRKKNNPILVGEPGSGKTAIAHGLAIAIVEKRVPHILLDKRVVEIEVTNLVAGSKYRGDLEERIKRLLQEVYDDKNIILFIDEIHTIIGGGGASGSLDIANMLKPALSSGKMQCIGATTYEEYRKNIEKDGALSRRFQKVKIEPTSIEDTINIIMNLKEKYEDHHNVNYSKEVIEECVKLTDRYINDRFLPDKAIDALDEVGSRVHIKNIDIPEHIKNLEQDLKDCVNEKSKAIKSQQYEQAAKLRDEERNITDSINKEKNKWKEELVSNRISVSVEDVAEVVSMMTGVPITSVNIDEKKKLREMSETISKKVIGQGEAVDKIVNAIKRNRLGVRDKNRPQGVFLLVGNSGTGKTHLAKVVSKELFGDSNLIRINMNEYSEKISITKLLGASAGYTGFDETKTPLEEIRKQPYSVVLLDEMEKAHPEVFTLFLQAFDEGLITDNKGVTISLKNTIIMMTSNVGVKKLRDFGNGVGFNTKTKLKDNDLIKQSIIDGEIKKEFVPEFLNRIDDIIFFNELSEDNISSIVRIELDKFVERILEKKINITYNDEVVDFIKEIGYDPQMGARPLKRAIQKHIEDLVADEMLKHDNIEDDSTFELSIKDGKVNIKYIEPSKIKTKTKTLSNKTRSKKNETEE